MFVLNNITIILILVILLVIVLISIFLNNNNIEKYSNNTNTNNSNNLNPDTYINTNNAKCCSKTSDNNLIPLAYNDFCNSLKDQSYKYEAPDEYNKYCANELLIIQPSLIASTPTASTPSASTPSASTPPASTPPASTPPASTPPASTPPASTPPALTPPASTPETTISVTYPIIKPHGYGSIRGWYSDKKSSYLYDSPIAIYYNQMNNNYVNNNQQWKLAHIPRVDELPNYGDWWNWTTELENINRVIDYLGTTLGKFETHFIAATPVINPLIWIRKLKPSTDAVYAISNTNLMNAISNKISNNNFSVANIIFTQSEWNNFNITTNLITLHYIIVGDKQYRPSSPGTDRVNNEALAIIANDWKIGCCIGTTTPNLSLRVEECGGVCLKYMTKTNKQRLYMACDLGMGHTPILNGSWFNSQSSDYKRQWLRNEIYASISHEYTHVYQNHLLEPLLPGRWFGEEGNIGERGPNAISRWWLECFATILPYFMGFNFSGFDMQSKINEAINIIKTSNSLTAREFSDRMMYVNPYGYLPGSENMVWSYLTATYMAKLTSWKYILVDFYYDFQRVPSNAQVYSNGTYINVPDLDKLFLHNFGKTEETFLQDVYRDVKNDTINIQYLSNVLPLGSDFNISNLNKFQI